ncbi:formimidoylglutamate deiminase [Roseovarius rhodophyticola]|uniref:Formimidoylglutamate deiminase n=1 Tax=Roseovarius rhodophyticola TaxID=3080827 RepID=A0ABZ2TIC8_9RHOB|nr:formimidoylglutamate deiminase [Roseovarius sp. W115]MDV2929799.1 formimidoylglutamate deiminase [Roseovarius sp. W115]
MTIVWAQQALLPDGWAKDVSIHIDAEGRIESVTPSSEPQGQRMGLLLPAPVNAHSHAFQRAMAGLTERRGPDGTDSFWTWRRLMYRFLDRLTPDHVEAIAALVQMEMLEAGYATNVEFHYLHHAPDGTPYARLSEMAERIAAAAEATGTGLTLLPVHYQFGGCDGRPLGPGQVRFGNDADRYARLVEDCHAIVKTLPADTALGVAPHSLRAVSREDVLRAADLFPAGPVHMHLAEQVAEVEEVEAAYGARPVEWLLDNADLSERWCLIHCTQMQPDETTRMAKTGAVAGLCPITEASLGDGIFDGVRWVQAGGQMAVGSDSNIRISLCEELRQLEYSQRLRDRSRAALATGAHSTGRAMFDAIFQGGAKAAGRQTGRIENGAWADLLALDMEHVDLVGLDDDTALDSFIFAGSNAMVDGVWSAGRHVVQAGRHINRDRIVRAYAAATAELRDLI